MIVDSHCHLHFPDFDEDRAQVIERAQAAGVQILVNVGTDLVTNQQASDLAAQYDFMHSTVGLHPHSAHETDATTFENLKKSIQSTNPVAIGEIGLDYFKSEGEAKTQKDVFVKMIHLAQEHALPAIVHSRNAFEDTLEIIQSEGGGHLRGVMHCFSYEEDSLRKLLDQGFLASFTCNVTFKSAAALLEVLKFAPLDRIMFETDSPYLSPQILRGKRNEPANLKHLVEFVAEKRGVPVEEVERVTTQTAIDFFKLKQGA